MSNARKLAEEHWMYVESICHKMYVDAFIHGMKHGFGDRVFLTDFEDKRDKLLDEIDKK